MIDFRSATNFAACVEATAFEGIHKMQNARIQEVNGGRTFLIDNDNEGLPDSVFLVEVGGMGLVMEFDRVEVVAVLKQAYNLQENWDSGLAQLLAA